MKKVKIALLGLGNVGKGVLSIIRENKEQIVKRSGYEVEIAKILVRDKDKDRGIEIPSEILTTNYDDILNDEVFQRYIRFENKVFHIIQKIEKIKGDEVGRERIYEEIKLDLADEDVVHYFDHEFNEKDDKLKDKMIAKKFFNKINNSLEKIFDYSKLYSLKECSRDRILKSLDVTVCPYCNRQYITSWTDSTNNSEHSTADLDHFFAKSVYPLFSLSLFNFIPSCQICNSRLKKDFIIEDINRMPIYPYKENFGDNGVFVLKEKTNKKSKRNYYIDQLELMLGIYDGDSYELKIDIDFEKDKQLSDKIDLSTKLFHLNEIYQIHVKYAFEVLRKQAVYSDSSYLKMLNEQFKEKYNIDFKRSELEKILYGFDWQNGEDPNRPLSKLTYDLLKRNKYT